MIITINREYGAGGHSVGNLLHEKLGIPFYDKDLVRIVAKEKGYPIEDIEQEENMTGMDSFMRMLAPTAYNDQKYVIHEYQKEIMLELAAKGDCIILGRCADTIVSEAGFDTLNVFLYAGEPQRAEYLKKIMNTNDLSKIHKAMKSIDSARKSYYNHYTGNRWDDCHNYNLALDTGLLGFEATADIICEAYNRSK